MAKKEPKAYIYKITNKTNGKWYIGSHEGYRKNYMGSGVALNNAYQKYGIENFTKEILFYSDNHREDETNILTELDAANDPMSYNIINSGEGLMTGYKMSDETKKKMSEKAQGRTFSEETRKKLSASRTGKKNPRYGKPMSEEAKTKIRLKVSGEKSVWWGKNHSDEAKAKISKANSGENHPMWGVTPSDEHRRKLSEANMGVKHELVTCTACGHSIGIRWSSSHFENCKYGRRKIVVEEGKEFFTTKEVAEILGISKLEVSRKIRDGWIEAFKLKNIWIVPVHLFIKRFGLEED